MAESIVKVPQDAASDMDFLAFSFNGQHSWDNFGIYRVIDGDRYNENLSPTLTDKTAEVPGGDGMYYFNTYHKQKDFSINFAFDNLSEVQLRDMRKWLNGKEIGDLWFSEAPYKVYSAKVTGQPTVKYIPFDSENGGRVYKGEGTIQFTAYWPYAHTPDFVATYYYDIIVNNSPEYYQLSSDLSLTNGSKIWIWEKDVGYVTNCGLEYGSADGDYGSFSYREGYYYFDDDYDITIAWLGFTKSLSCQIYVGELDNLTPIELKNLTPVTKNSNGLLLSSYNQFGNKDQWAGVSGLTNIFTPGSNNGDLPAPFILKQDGYIPAGAKFTVGEAEITTTSDCYNLEWDTKTGLVIAGDAITVTDYKEKKPIDVIGDTCAAIPVGGVEEIKGEMDKITITEMNIGGEEYITLHSNFNYYTFDYLEDIHKISFSIIKYYDDGQLKATSQEIILLVSYEQPQTFEISGYGKISFTVEKSYAAPYYTIIITATSEDSDWEEGDAICIDKNFTLYTVEKTTPTINYHYWYY